MTLARSLWILSLTALTLAGCARKQEAVPEPAAEPVEAAAAETAEQSVPMAAVAPLQTREGTLIGTVSFSQTDGTVRIAAHVERVEAGMHGFHVHEIGDCSGEDFTSAGGHFNPTEAPHGAPSDSERHAGDLGNIQIGEDGMGNLELTSEMLTVEEGPYSVMGRAVILHAQEDDLVSQPTGAAGGRIACGVVGAVEAM